jgi:hypothetical protein
MRLKMRAHFSILDTGGLLHMSKTRFFSWLATGVLSVAAASTASATVTPLAYYHLGEADAGASNGAPGAAVTTDSVGGFTLTRTNVNPPLTASYTSSVSPSAASHTGSTLGMNLNGSYYTRFGAGAQVTNAPADWGIEAWVKADNPDDPGAYVLAYNGHADANGMGFYQYQGFYQGFMGGVAVLAGLRVDTNWHHLAMVTSFNPSFPGDLSHRSTTMYVDGVAAVSTPQGIINGNDEFSIGGRSVVGGPASVWNGGQIDEVRVFNFATGQFSPSDLLLNSTVPEPTTLALLATGSLVAMRRRRS